MYVVLRNSLVTLSSTSGRKPPLSGKFQSENSYRLAVINVPTEQKKTWQIRTFVKPFEWSVVRSFSVKPEQSFFLLHIQHYTFVQRSTG